MCKKQKRPGCVRQFIIFSDIFLTYSYQYSNGRANGTLEAQLRYDPWGEERYTVGTTPTGYRYTGQRHMDRLHTLN